MSTTSRVKIAVGAVIAAVVCLALVVRVLRIERATLSAAGPAEAAAVAASAVHAHAAQAPEWPTGIPTPRVPPHLDDGFTEAMLDFSAARLPSPLHRPPTTSAGARNGLTLLASAAAAPQQ